MPKAGLLGAAKMRSCPADKDDRKKSKLFDIMCQACGHHLVTQNISQMCLKCGSLLISCDTSDRDGDDQMSEDCHDSNNKHVRDWAPQRATSVKSFAQVERLSSGIKHGDVTGDAALAEQLRAIDLTLKSLLRMNTLCDCNCEKCLAGDCEDCSDPECVDPNCEGSVKPRREAEELAMLKDFAMQVIGGRTRMGRF